MPPPLTPRQFQDATGIDDATLAKFETYAQLLEKWQPTINLVGPDTMNDIWGRHFLDSAQLAPMIDPEAIVADLGSGAGFPGMVLAILGVGKQVHLVESDQRKSTFLSTVNRACAAGATVHVERIEKLKPIGADVVTSRALAPLEKLLKLAQVHQISTGKCLFLKGKRWREELTAAEKVWKMRATERPSITDGQAAILELTEISSL